MLTMEHRSHQVNEKNKDNKFSEVRIIFDDPKDTQHRKIIKMDTMTWYKFRQSDFEKVVTPILKLLNDRECERLFYYYVKMKETILHMTKENFGQSVKEMEEETTRVFFDIDLDNKIYSYVSEDTYPFPNLDSVGTRAHDTKDMTFRLNEYIEVTGIQVVCKFMAPIWGEMFDKIKVKNNPLTGSDNREYYCSIIVEDFLEKSRFSKIYYKLVHYIDVTTESQLKYDNDSNSAQFILSNNGVSLPKFKDIMKAVVLVKKFVSYNAFYNEKTPKDPPNIMSNVNSSVKETTEGRCKQWRQRSDILPKYELKDIASDDNDNTSFLDHTSPASMKTVDVAILNRFTVQYSIKRYIRDNQIDPELFNEAMEYYLLKKLNVSSYSKGLCASILTVCLHSSSQVLKYINIKEYIQIVIIAQIHLLKSSLPLEDLAALLSSEDLPIAPDDIQNNNRKEKLFKFFNKNPVLEECKSLFPAQVYFVEPQETAQSSQAKKMKYIATKFDTQLKSMVDWLSSYTHRVNIAPSIWKICQVEKTLINTSIIDVTSDTISNLCRFFINIHSGD